MVKRKTCRFALAVLLSCDIALGGDVDLTSFTPYGLNYGSVGIVNGALVNQTDSDSRLAVALLPGEMGAGRLLHISLSVRLGVSNAVHFALLNSPPAEGCPQGGVVPHSSFLIFNSSLNSPPAEGCPQGGVVRISCDGRWRVHIGDGSLLSFEEPPPPPFAGERVFNLDLLLRIADGRLFRFRGDDAYGSLNSPPAGGYLNSPLAEGGHSPLNSPPAEGWRDSAGVVPSLNGGLLLSLRGEGSAVLAVSVETVDFPTIILIR